MFESCRGRFENRSSMGILAGFRRSGLTVSDHRCPPVTSIRGRSGGGDRGIRPFGAVGGGMVAGQVQKFEGTVVPEHELSDSYDGLLAQVSAAIVEARVNSQLAVVSELARVHQRLAEGTVVRDERGIDGDVPHESDLDREMANDPYLFDFLGIERPVPPTNSRPAPEHAIISTLEAYLLGLRAGFALAGCPYRLVTADEGVVLIDLLFFHIPTKRYIAIVVADEGPMDFVVDKARHLAAVVDDTAIGVHNETIGLAVLATDDGAIIRYSYPDGTDAGSKAFMPDKDDLTAVLSGAVDVLTI